MKKVIIIASIWFWGISAMGQSNLGNKEAADNKVIDNATLRCYYLFSKKKEYADKAYRTDTMTLDIGSKVSKFYDPARLERDSLLGARMKNMDPQSIKSIDIYKGAKNLSNLPGTTASDVNQGESYQIIKDKKTNKITVLDYISTMGIGDRFKYEDETGVLPWKISNTTDTVLSYTCQKATLNFRGRNYIAWFTTDIPVNDGPWKFAGLPGLILKVEDDKGLFSFKLIGLQQQSAPLPIQVDDSKNVKCTRAEFEKIKKRQGSGMQVNINAGKIIIAEVPGTYDYNPMEIE